MQTRTHDATSDRQNQTTLWFPERFVILSDGRGQWLRFCPGEIAPPQERALRLRAHIYNSTRASVRLPNLSICKLMLFFSLSLFSEKKKKILPRLKSNNLPAAFAFRTSVLADFSHSNLSFSFPRARRERERRERESIIIITYRYFTRVPSPGQAIYGVGVLPQPHAAKSNWPK